MNVPAVAFAIAHDVGGRGSRGQRQCARSEQRRFDEKLHVYVSHSHVSEFRTVGVAHKFQKPPTQLYAMMRAVRSNTKLNMSWRALNDWENDATAKVEATLVRGPVCG
jgi:hypothetical protein